MKLSKGNSNTPPFDENGITSLLFLEDSVKKNENDQSIVKKLVEIYAVI